jgi:hypothetical protein
LQRIMTPAFCPGRKPAISGDSDLYRSTLPMN